MYIIKLALLESLLFIYLRYDRPRRVLSMKRDIVSLTVTIKVPTRM